MTKTMVCFISMMIVFSATKAVDAQLVAIGLQKQLLVDDYVIAQKQNVNRELGKPIKMGVVMKASVPTDFHPASSSRMVCLKPGTMIWVIVRRSYGTKNSRNSRCCTALLLRISPLMPSPMTASIGQSPWFLRAARAI